MVHAHAHVESGKFHDGVREGIQESENRVESQRVDAVAQHEQRGEAFCMPMG